MFLKDDVIFYIRSCQCAIHVRESSGQRNFWEKTVACDCIEIVTENWFFMDFQEVDIKISCNDDVTVRYFKLRKYSCKFVNKLSVVFIDVTRWSINITQYDFFGTHTIYVNFNELTFPYV